MVLMQPLIMVQQLPHIVLILHIRMQVPVGGPQRGHILTPYGWMQQQLNNYGKQKSITKRTSPTYGRGSIQKGSPNQMEDKAYP